MNLFKKNEGAITVYLAIILSVMLILTGVLVDGARARTAEAQVQSTTEAAANSLLANYNNILKEWFGLMSLSENNSDVLEEELMYYLNRNLMTELGAEKANLSDESWNYVKKFLGSDNKYNDVNFIDMYDYRIEEVSACPMYNLSESAVLRSQIVEYMKYRAPEALGEEFLEKINVLKSFKKQSEALSSKLEIDRSLNEIKKELEKLSNDIEKVNLYDAKVLEDKLKKVCEKTTEKVLLEKECEYLKEQKKNAEEELNNYKKSESYKKELKSLSDQLAAAADQSEREAILAEIGNLCKSYEDVIKTAKEAYDRACDNYSSCEDEAKELIKDLNKYIDEYYGYSETALAHANKVMGLSTDILKQIEDMELQLKGDTSDFAEKMKQEISKIKKQVSKESMEDLIEKFKTNLNCLGDKADEKKGILGKGLKYRLAAVKLKEIDKDTGKLTGFSKDDKTKISDYILKDIVNINDLLKNYVQKYKKISSSEFKIEKTVKSSKKIEDPRKASNDLVKSSDNPLKELEASKEHEDFDEKLKGLPSGGAKISSEGILKAFLGNDYDFVAGAIKSKEKSNEDELKKSDAGNVVNSMNFTDEDNKSPSEGFGLISELIGVLEQGLEGLRDEMYVGEYALGTFNNYLSTKTLKSTEGNTINQVDLRGRERGERKPYLYFENEIEYILGGTSDDNLNVYNVMAKILLIRFVLNTIYIYTDGEKSKEAYLAATAIAGWTGFGVPIVQTLIMLSWSMAESVLDVKFLMSGKSVAIFKTSDTWVLGAAGGLSKIKDEIQDTVVGGVKKYAQKAVDYGTDKAEDIADAATQNVYDTINTKVENVVEKFFAPVEEALNGTDKAIRNNYAEITGSLENELAGLENEDMSYVVKEIYKLAEEEYRKVKVDMENQLTRPIDEAKERIEKTKQTIKSNIATKLTDLKKSIKGKISEAAKSGKEGINKYIDSFGSKSAGTAGNSYKNIKASILSLNYEGYLRVLLMMMLSREEKITRIQDLIQLQMTKMTGNNDFKLSDCNTYVGVKVNVSMKYFFMTQPFVKNELKTEDYKRHILSVKILKGY